MFHSKQKIRLLKPSRRKAPTEYNIQYKKWPPNMNLADNYKMNRSGKLIPKALLDAPGNLKGRLLNNGHQTKTSQVPSYLSFETEKDSNPVYKLNKKNYDVKTSVDLSNSLRATSAPIHSRSIPHKTYKIAHPEYSGVYCDDVISVPTSHDYGDATRRPNTACKRPKTGRQRSNKKDVTEQRVIQDDLAAKLKYLSMHSPNPEYARDQCMKSKKFSKNYIPTKDLKFSHQNFITKTKKKNNIDKPSSKLSSPEFPYEVKSYKEPSFPKVLAWKPIDDPSIPPPPSTSPHPGYAVLTDAKPSSPVDNCMGYKRKKPFNIEGLDEKSLREVYHEATLDDLKRLNDTYKEDIGLIQNVNTAEPPCVLEKSEPSEDENRMLKVVSKEEENEIRRTAYKNSQVAKSGPQNNSAWITSYHLDYCLWLPKEENKAGDSGKSDDKTYISGKLKDEENFVKSQNKAKICSCSTEKPKYKISDAGNTIFPKRTESEEDRILEEARQIEQREHNNVFRRDGKPKMQKEGHYESTFKGHNCRKPETPVWANKTMVSLGSGHWNLLSHIDDDWRLNADVGDPSLRSIREEMEKKYKIKVCEPKKNDKMDVVDLEQEASPSIVPCSKAHRNVCKTEYMRTFHRLPLPKRKVVM